MSGLTFFSKVPALKKWIPLFLVLLFFSLWFPWNNRDSGSVHSSTQLAMGTLVTVSTWGTGDVDEGKKVARIFERIRQVEAIASRQDANSPVYRINHSPQTKHVAPPEALVTIIEKGLEIRQQSQGAFDPGLASLLDLWGFTHGVPEKGALPEQNDLSAWLEKRNQFPEYGIHLNKDPNGTVTLHLDGDVFALDLGAIAKGYALDQAMATMKQSGIQDGLIIGGGDMIIAGSKGGKPWRIGIQHPRDRDKVMAQVEVMGDMALATSGDYERFFMVNGERQHHILDSKTGKPSRSGLISVSIQANEAMVADALSTAVFVLGMEKGKALIEQLDGVEGMLVQENGERWKSPQFKGQWLDEQKND
ncbi:MAG: FAD:protein FMN transferase [Magnetococcales bacterium]|nr:FAD:protein FMN transferase [Magnetococcales bacterium]MBF0152022.1 FAD:protein FMN transferase [Magnetococcales bacterium]